MFFLITILKIYSNNYLCILDTPLVLQSQHSVLCRVLVLNTPLKPDAGLDDSTYRYCFLFIYSNGFYFLPKLRIYVHFEKVNIFCWIKKCVSANYPKSKLIQNWRTLEYVFMAHGAITLFFYQKFRCLAFS